MRIPYLPINMLLKSYRRTRTANTATMIITAHAPTDPPIAIGKGSIKLFWKMSTNFKEVIIF